MTDRYASSSYRARSLPDWHPWISRLSGVLCFAAAVLAGIAVWRDYSVVGIVIFGICVVAGSLLVSLPEYFRYYSAVRFTPPLPDRIEEAFDQTYENLRELRDALERIGEVVQQHNRPPEDTVDSECVAEIEEALSQLKLDFDEFAENLKPLLPSDEGEGSRALPSNLLAKALSGAGKGKGFPFSGKGEGS